MGKVIDSDVKNTNSIAKKELEENWVIINREFPFKGYINQARKSGYFDMVRKVVKWSGRKGDVLDFGAGPCDKTALFSLVGLNITAYDNLQDAWHYLDSNRQKILDFSKSVGIDYMLPDDDGNLPKWNKKYDVIMAHDVLEHFHSTPRILMNKLISDLKTGGLVAITVPNAANIRKRIHLLFGKTNYPKYEYFYWYPGDWSGHVREYVSRDLKLLSKFLNLEILELSTYNLQLDVLPKYLRPIFKLFSIFAPGFRDSWMLIARKPEKWEPNYKPNDDQFQEAFGSQYFDYSGKNLNWEN